MFQLPWLPEAALAAQDFAALRWVFTASAAREGAYTPEDLDRLVEAMARPGALKAALNYYRAALRHPGRVPADRQHVAHPVLLIWGEKDRALGLELAHLDPRRVPNGRVERLPDAGHFVESGSIGVLSVLIPAPVKIEVAPISWTPDNQRK